METIILNNEQQEAVCYGKRCEKSGFESPPLLIIAGAGTGKTNTLANRAAHLIIKGVDPNRILLMTFSRRAAGELADRTKRIVAAELKIVRNETRSVNLPWMGTFHSIANKLLREHASIIGLSSSFTIIDNSDATDLLDVLRHELNLCQSQKRFPKKSTCLNIYSRCVNSQMDIAKVLELEFPWCEDWEHELRQLFRLYSKRKQEQVTLDYDDLLLYWYYMVQNKEYAKRISEQFDHVLVDEYQDTNRLQAAILSCLFPSGKGLTVVGDDAQSIYRFRSAEIENILNFPQQFKPAAKVITLKTNYRSTQPILNLSNSLLAQSEIGYQKELISCASSTPYAMIKKPALVKVEDDAGQAKYIVEKVLENREMGQALKQNAVLFRSSFHSDRLEIELMRADIPYIKYGGLKFLEAAHVKDLLSIIRWINNPKHFLSGNRVLRLLPNVGPKLAQKALIFLQNNHFQLDALSGFLTPTNVSEGWEQLIEFINACQPENSNWPTQMDLAQQFYTPLLELKYDDS